MTPNDGREKKIAQQQNGRRAKRKKNETDGDDSMKRCKRSEMKSGMDGANEMDIAKRAQTESHE